MLRHVTEQATPRPGVYRMLSEEGGVLYVGKAKRLRDRLLSYFRADRRDKESRVLREARAIEWTHTPSEFAALREELRQIKHYRPRLNVQRKHDAEHYAFLRITTGPAPKLTVERRDATGEGVFYGPFIGPDLAADAAKNLSDALGLRDCPDTVPMRFRRPEAPIPLGRAPSVSMGPRAAPNPGALRAPDCIRHDVGKCLGPCVEACTRTEYDERVKLLRAFLEGQSKGPIERFRREMNEAKDRQAYERAALFRDRLHRLEQLRRQFSKIRFTLESLSLVYPVPGFEGDDRVYLLRRGTVRAEAKAPTTTEERLHLQRLIDQVYQPREPEESPVRTHEIEEILVLSAWFSQNPGELARAWRPTVS